MYPAAPKCYISSRKIALFKQEEIKESQPKVLPPSKLTKTQLVSNQSKISKNPQSTNSDSQQSSKIPKSFTGKLSQLLSAYKPIQTTKSVISNVSCVAKKPLNSNKSQPQNESAQQNNSDYELSDEELQVFMDLSDEKSRKKEKKVVSFQLKKKNEKKQHVSVDTNVFQVNLPLTSVQQVLEKPVLCTSCNSMLNSLSKVNQLVNGITEWQCEFCDQVMSCQGKPNASDICYQTQQASLEMNNKEKSVVICVDSSGSMMKNIYLESDSNSQYCKKRELHLKKNQSQPSEDFDQAQDKGSLLVEMLSACDSNINQIALNEPNTKLGLVQFNNKVNVIGDGTQPVFELDVENQNCTEQELTAAVDSKGDTLFTKPISLTKDSLCERLMGVQAGGCTALGPAALTSVILAQKHRLGSNVVICTDGEANVGLGDFSNDNAEAFYERVGKVAAQSGVTVNLIALVGANCNVQALSKMCEKSGGLVANVEAKQLHESLTKALNQKIIASQVVVTIKLHKYFKFRNESASDLSEDQSSFTRHIGNAPDSNISFTFEYELKSNEELQKLGKVDLESITELPFQMQVQYTNLDGSKYVRVITNYLKVSHDRKELEQAANGEILLANALQQASKLARRGQVKQAQSVAVAWSKNFEKQDSSQPGSQINKTFKKEFTPIYQALKEEMRSQPMPHQRLIGGQMPRFSDKLSSQLYTQSVRR